jgi:lipopolysaccharide transport system ATP-binding protein
VNAIELVDVSKRFILRPEKRPALQDTLIGWARDPLGIGRSRAVEFWALRHLNLTIDPGETVGIVGPNGSGKSTTLRLIARTVEPTSGRVRVAGRVAALLGLGVGFHGDLTGRENIYLNASFLGHSRRYVDSKLEEIVAFAEIGDFVNVPIRHYSSGMLLRLGFSVAIHTEAEILLIDEVLAVGDASFQRKCNDRLFEFQRSGKTTVVVSHSLESLRTFCDRVVWIEDGRVRQDGPAGTVLDAYVGNVNTRQLEAEEEREVSPLAAGAATPENRWGTREVEITAVQFLDGAARPRTSFLTGEPMTIRIHYLAHQRIPHPAFGIAIYAQNGMHVAGTNSRAFLDVDTVEGTGQVEFTLDSLLLLEGTYLVTAAVHDQACYHPYDYHHQAFAFRVQPGGIKEHEGLVALPSRWSHRAEGFGRVREDDLAGSRGER